MRSVLASKDPVGAVKDTVDRVALYFEIASVARSARGSAAIRFVHISGASIAFESGRIR